MRLRGSVLGVTTLLLWVLSSTAQAVLDPQLTLTSGGEGVKTEYVVFDEEGEKVDEGETNDRGVAGLILPREGKYRVVSKETGAETTFDSTKTSRVALEVGTIGAATLGGLGLALDQWEWGIATWLKYEGIKATGTSLALGPGANDRKSSHIHPYATALGIEGRAYSPCSCLFGGRPFFGLNYREGVVSRRDRSSRSGDGSTQTQTSVTLEFDRGIGLVSGMEYDGPEVCGRPMRVRPFLGVDWTRYTARLDAFDSGNLDRDNKHFWQPSGVLGLEVGVPLRKSKDCEIDLVAGFDYSHPIGDDSRTLYTPASGGTDALGKINIDGAYQFRVGTEVRF